VKGASKGTVFCAAGRSSTITGTPAVRIATGTTRTTSTGTTGFVLVFLTSLFLTQISNLRGLPEMRRDHGCAAEASMMAG